MEAKIQNHNLSFAIESPIQKKALGDSGLTQFSFRVSFGDEKEADMFVRAQTLEIAMKMLQAFGKEVERFNAAEFDDFKERHECVHFHPFIKDVNSSSLLRSEKTGERAIVYRLGSTGNSFERKCFELPCTILEEIRAYADSCSGKAVDYETSSEEESDIILEALTEDSIATIASEEKAAYAKTLKDRLKAYIEECQKNPPTVEIADDYSKESDEFPLGADHIISDQ